MIDIQEILIQIGQTGIIVAGSAFVLKKYLELIFSKDLEKFKADLEKSSIEFKIRYEKLHTERAEVIKTLYQKISRADLSLHRLISPSIRAISEKDRKLKEEIAIKNGLDLIDYYDENKIFLEESLAREIDNLIQTFEDCLLYFCYAQEISKENTKKGIKEWDSTWNKLTKGEVPAMKRFIENKFRSIIGING